MICSTRQTEQSDIQPYYSLLKSEQVHRVYLDELGEIRQLSVPLALLVLTTLGLERAAAEVQYLLSRETVGPSFSSQTLVDIVTTIMVYRYEGSSQREIEQMLEISLKETRAYREIKAEGREEGLEEGLDKGREEEARSLITRQLTRKLGPLPDSLQTQVNQLALEVLEALGEALFDLRRCLIWKPG